MPSIRRELFAGELLYRQGEPSDCAWLIESGSVELVSTMGRRTLSQGVLGEGELLGELSLLDEAPRSATAAAASDAVLLAIDAGQFAERLADSDPIVRALVDGLRKRCRAILSALPADAELPAEDAPCTDPADRSGIDKIRLETHLRDALHTDALEVRYQPIYDILQQRVTGYEALVRWQHPERGAVSPAEFIKLAEETSLIVPIGEYVLDRVCALLATLQQQSAGAEPLSIAVNLSARQLVEPGMARQVVARMQRAGLPAGALKLEVTESRMLDYAPVATVMRYCRDHGIRFALDDFGTGYSNLTHLYKLDFEFVKIDQAFARHMFDSPRAMAIVEAIVAMAHGIGAAVIMEGVETREQLQRLAQLGVRYAQGYLVGQAQPAAAVLSGEAAGFAG